MFLLRAEYIHLVIVLDCLLQSCSLIFMRSTCQKMEKLEVKKLLFEYLFQALPVYLQCVTVRVLTQLCLKSQEQTPYHQ